MMLKRNFQISNQALNQITNSSQELEEPGSNSIGLLNINPWSYTMSENMFVVYCPCWSRCLQGRHWYLQLVFSLGAYQWLMGCSWPPFCHRSPLGCVKAAAAEWQGNGQVLIPCWCIPAARKSEFLHSSDSIDVGNFSELKTEILWW